MNVELLVEDFKFLSRNLKLLAIKQKKMKLLLAFHLLTGWTKVIYYSVDFGFAIVCFTSLESGASSLLPDWVSRGALRMVLDRPIAFFIFRFFFHRCHNFNRLVSFWIVKILYQRRVLSRFTGFEGNVPQSISCFTLFFLLYYFL